MSSGHLMEIADAAASASAAAAEAAAWASRAARICRRRELQEQRELAAMRLEDRKPAVLGDVDGLMSAHKRARDKLWQDLTASLEALILKKIRYITIHNIHPHKNIHI